jgi:hypothetical protein
MLSELKEQRLANVKKTNFLAYFEKDFENFISQTLGLSKAQTGRRIDIYKGITDSKLITKKNGDFTLGTSNSYG